jgi:hypothetical protein
MQLPLSVASASKNHPAVDGKYLEKTTVCALGLHRPYCSSLVPNRTMKHCLYNVHILLGIISNLKMICSIQMNVSRLCVNTAQLYITDLKINGFMSGTKHCRYHGLTVY